MKPCSSCGTVGKAVADNTWDPRFESAHHQLLFTVNSIEKTKISKKRSRLVQYKVELRGGITAKHSKVLTATIGTYQCSNPGIDIFCWKNWIGVEQNNRLEARIRTVWPDDEIKSSPSFSKSSLTSLTKKERSMVFTTAQKVTKHLSYFCNKINRPIWSHWIRPKDKLNCPRALCRFAISCSTQRGVTFR